MRRRNLSTTRSMRVGSSLTSCSKIPSEVWTEVSCLLQCGGKGLRVRSSPRVRSRGSRPVTSLARAPRAAWQASGVWHSLSPTPPLQAQGCHGRDRGRGGHELVQAQRQVGAGDPQKLPGICSHAPGSQLRFCAVRPDAACESGWPSVEECKLNPRRADSLFSCSCAVQEVAVDPRDLNLGREIGIASSLPCCGLAAFCSLLAHPMEVAAYSTRV
jgi:hypothetical protein